MPGLSWGYIITNTFATSSPFVSKSQLMKAQYGVLLHLMVVLRTLPRTLPSATFWQQDEEVDYPAPVLLQSGGDQMSRHGHRA